LFVYLLVFCSSPQTSSTNKNVEGWYENWGKTR
jgi:hypothetical protein